MRVEIKTLSPVRVAYRRHVGPYGSPGIAQMWQEFAAWCTDAGLMNPRRRMYGISQDNPETTPPEKCRYDACIEIDTDFTPSGDVRVQTIQGGKYACAEFTGAADDIYAGWMRFINEVLADKRYQMEDRPPLELYDTDYSIDEATGVFTCLLCVSVRSA